MRHTPVKVIYANNEEGPPWRCCSYSLVPRSEVIHFVQVSIIVLIIILCFTRLFIISKRYAEKSIWIELLSNLVGYNLPNTKIWTKLSLLMTRSSCQLWGPVTPKTFSGMLKHLTGVFYFQLLFRKIELSSEYHQILRIWNYNCLLIMTIHAKKLSTKKSVKIATS